MISKQAVLEIITSYLGEGIDGSTLVSMTKSINSLPSISEDGFKRDIIFKLSLALSDYFNDDQLSLIKQCLNKLIPVPISDGWISVGTPPKPTFYKWYQCATDTDVLLTACYYGKHGFVPYGSAQEDGRVKYYRPMPPSPNPPQK